jgi:hypothetical protein
LAQAETCGGVKPVNRIPVFPLLNIFAIFEKVREGCQDKPQLTKNSFTNLTEFN